MKKMNICLWFDNEAEAAVKYYMSVFKDGKILSTVPYITDTPSNKPKGSVMVVYFEILGETFLALNGGPYFKLSEAVSFVVNCKDQKEIDYYWEKLSAVPESEQCGWLKDKYGVSWQIVPTAMDEMMEKGSKEQIAQVTEAFLKMKKFDIAQLQKAYEGG